MHLEKYKRDLFKILGGDHHRAKTGYGGNFETVLEMLLIFGGVNGESQGVRIS